MDYLRLKNDFLDPEALNLEIVERKGLGHPDTLADALAELVSMDYSAFCLKNFGAVLHHNIDKLYIGAGLFKSNFGYCLKEKPVQVFINGRMSNYFGGQKIDLERLQKETILGYLGSILPRLREDDVVINNNTTQNSRIPFWFSPRDSRDLPESTKLQAGDNAVCVFSWPLTAVEQLVYSLEDYFWEKSEKFPNPKFDFLGQDIKILACREDRNVNISVRVPVISSCVKNQEEYDSVVRSVKDGLSNLAAELVSDQMLIDLEVNAHKPYLLGVGSCIECGEEGLVGRGNANSGLISIFRPHSVEAPSGKNPIYHTGRVLNFLVMNLSQAIYKEFAAKNTVLAATKNGGSLVPPYLLSISTDKKISQKDIERVIKKYFLEIDYLARLLSERQVK